MTKFKLIVSYNRDAAEKIGESLFHEEDAYSSYYLDWLGRKMVADNKDLVYNVYSFKE